MEYVRPAASATRPATIREAVDGAARVISIFAGDARDLEMLMHSVAASGIPGSEYGRLKPLDRPNGKLVSNAEWASSI
jgi:hypothetical protein